MIIEYSSRKLEKVLTNPLLTKKHYGRQAKKILLRLSEIKTADNLDCIPCTPPPRRHKLSNACWGIDYSKNYRIVIKPIGIFDINDLTTIKAVILLELVDYH